MGSAINENRKLVNKSLDEKDKLLKNIKLSDLASKFESALGRVEELELHHLIEPIKLTAQKLRQLEEVTEKLACDYYDDYPCANKNCCNELNVNLNEEPRKATGIISKNESIETCSSDDSCKCRNADGSKSCHCGSEESYGKKLISTLGSKNTERRIGGKCNPCKCSLDASGRKAKTLDCKLAARKRRRDEELKWKSDDDDVIIERRISSSRLNIHTNLNDMSLNVNKENTVVKDKAYIVKVKEKNQATFCNLSSESSTEEYDSESSSGGLCCGKNCVDGTFSSFSNEPTIRCLAQKDGFWRSDADLGSCGCGRQVDGGENESCPCGCGDMMNMPEDEAMRRLECRCENCGKEIATSSGRSTEKASISLNGSAVRRQDERKILETEKLAGDGCVIPYADIRMYIEDLEAQCREKDNIITELTQARGSVHPPTYIT